MQSQPRGCDVFYKAVGPAPIRVVAVSIDCAEIFIAARSIHFRKPQDRSGQSWIAAYGALGKNLLVPVFERLLGSSSRTVEEQLRTQRRIL